MAEKKTVVKGRDLMLFKASGSSPDYTWAAFGAALTHTLNVNTEELDVSNKDTGEWGDSEAGLITWDLQCNSMMVETDYDELLQAQLNKEVFHIAFAQKSNPGSTSAAPEGGWTIGTGGWEGDVMITSITATAAHNDKATYDVTFKGKGPLSKRSS